MWIIWAKTFWGAADWVFSERMWLSRGIFWSRLGFFPNFSNKSINQSLWLCGTGSDFLDHSAPSVVWHTMQIILKTMFGGVSPISWGGKAVGASVLSDEVLGFVKEFWIVPPTQIIRSQPVMVQFQLFYEDAKLSLSILTSRRGRTQISELSFSIANLCPGRCEEFWSKHFTYEHSAFSSCVFVMHLVYKGLYFVCRWDNTRYELSPLTASF